MTSPLLTTPEQILAHVARALEVAHAERDAALAEVGRLVAYIRRVGGFMKAEDQAMLRGARAMLADAERGGK